jgi:uncharacterized protein
MLDIDEMGSAEMYKMLHKVGYGHLGCVHEGKPYVMPMNYYLDDLTIYLFSTVGMKTHDMDINPDVCLQVEEIRGPDHWRVIVTGQAEHLKAEPEIDRAMKFIKARNPTLSPAINRTWTDAQGRAEEIAIYRIHLTEMSGRTTEGISSQYANSQSTSNQ